MTQPARPATRRRTRAATPPAPPPSDSHARIVAAALDEFASQGFAGARVDRIAAAAGLNKAMLYYHFGSKADLYRSTIQDLIGTLATRLEAIAAKPGTPQQRLDDFIDTFIRMGLEQPRIAPVLLREIADGATRFDRGVVTLMFRIVGALAGILAAGCAQGTFRPVNPLLAYLTIVWPIMVYLASNQARQHIRQFANFDMTGLQPEHFIQHMQDVSRRTLAVPEAATRAPRTTGRSRAQAS